MRKKVWVPTILEFVRKIVICGSSHILGDRSVKFRCQLFSEK
ncbi:hypothetical protein LEP1GSC151_1769 [Leptospira interrogans serovar Grippotyphosa str. LT2186]|uniref:Uncharacterized protein n=4 Tax=Leptospira TaxID=171 RepID=M3I1D8_LEPIR|nr:hypothetical protein [Leptospira kirschneri]EKO85573.1 hypothetical protein LEP1GSC009_0104 [Leptospira interrogans serovar Grippotyphosa str. Andaman]EKP84841.1 hypothetical protein LEP1GSC020_0423 [Leptospira interrogans serovar Grippotyphosa str. 2006006986]EKR43296.1 hypothetical protein LEP1GSC097_1617 [Leptospira interrogans serovar Grippotyphosa str. UI 08368]EMG09712.1 hypothetical protein LEP1GSC151_1769 [Leptospira interrogans serovar Grippotyphosa str. LT2186]EMN28637.1 hypotheti